MPSRTWYFQGGDDGNFRILGINTVSGQGLPRASHLAVSQELKQRSATFSLRGVVSNERYVTRQEKDWLVKHQEPLGRPHAVCGALIPIRKNAEWWALSQDERRAIFEERSAHIQLGNKALPAIARRLHHCRDLSAEEPFDFLTWFDFSPEHEPIFDDLLGALRRTVEWEYVDREVDIRVERL